MIMRNLPLIRIVGTVLVWVECGALSIRRRSILPPALLDLATERQQRRSQAYSWRFSFGTGASSRVTVMNPAPIQRLCDPRRSLGTLRRSTIRQSTPRGQPQR
jgi:hypothetical protein